MNIYLNVRIGVFALLALASTVPAYITPKSKFEEGVLKIIEKVKTGDAGSLPRPFNFMSMSPVTVPPSTTTNSEGYKFSLGEGEVFGLEGMSVDKLSTFETWMLIELFVPQLTYRAVYTLQSEPIFGWRYLDDEGIFRCDVSNLKVWADVQFGTRNGNTALTYLNIHFVVSDVQVNLNNSMKMVNDNVLAKILNLIFSYETKENIQKSIKKQARRYLRGRTLEEFKNIISSV